MFQIEVRKADAILRKSEVITSGSVQAYGACFEFVHPIWQSLMKQAVFRCGDIQIGVMLDESGECVIPWEVLQSPGEVLEIGVYGVQGKDIVLPTIWVRAGTIRQGVDDCPGGRAPSPDSYQQLLSAIGDLKKLQTSDKSSLVSALNEVLAKSSGDAAEDSEVGDMLEDVFGEEEESVPDDQVATNQDVDTMLDGVFGDAPPVAGEVATDQDILSMLDGVFGNKETMWKYSSFWYKDFDAMAYKTMLRQLISKWGIMSTELQMAMENDMAAIRDDGTPEYVDNDTTPIEPAQAPVYEAQATEIPHEDSGEDDFFAGLEPPPER